MRRTWIYPLMFLLVGCTLNPITEPRRPNPENEPTMVPTAIAMEKPTYNVERGSVASQLFGSGLIAPVSAYQSRFPIDGRIDTLLISKGETVSAGDIIARLDTTSLEQSLVEAESAHNLAIEQLTMAQERRAGDLRRAEIAVELVRLQLDFAESQAGETPTDEEMVPIEELKLKLELAELGLSEIDSAVDSPRNSRVIWPRVAPRARSRPISLMRS